VNRLAIYAIIAVVIFLAGYGTGHHAKTVSDNAAIVKQVVKTAKVDAKNEHEVEKQDGSDKLKISQLEADLIAARAAAAARGVPKPAACRSVPQTQGDAGAREGTSPFTKPADPYEAAYRALRDDLLTAGAVAEKLRLQVLACQAQWPDR
jgi:hypothetical protein